MRVPLHSKKIHRKRSAYRFGIVAEWLAVVYYGCLGFLPRARRYKTKLGELDVVVANRQMVVFVEVKARAVHRRNRDFPLHPKQLERMHRAAMLWVAKHPHFANLEMRMEVLVVSPWRWPERLIIS